MMALEKAEDPLSDKRLALLLLWRWEEYGSIFRSFCRYPSLGNLIKRCSRYDVAIDGGIFSRNRFLEEKFPAKHGSEAESGDILRLLGLRKFYAPYRAVRNPYP